METKSNQTRESTASTEPISLREWLNTSILRNDEQETDENNQSEHKLSHVVYVIIICIIISIIVFIIISMELSNNLVSNFFSNNIIQFNATTSSTIPNTLNTTIPNTSNTYQMHRKQPNAPNTPNTLNTNTYISLDNKSNTNMSQVVKSLKTSVEHFHLENVLNIGITTRSVAFDDRLSAIIIMSEIPYAISSVISACRTLYKCQDFPYLWCDPRSIHPKITLNVNNVGVNAINYDCHLYNLQNQGFGFYGKFRVFSRKYKGANFAYPRSYTVAIVQCNTLLNKETLSNVNSILLSISIKVNITNPNWINKYWDNNKTKLYNQSSILNKLSNYNNTVFITENIHSNKFINTLQLSVNSNTRKSICFVFATMRHPGQLTYFHAQIEYVFNVIQKYVTAFVIDIIIYIDIKQLNSFISTITNISSFLNYYSINLNYLLDGKIICMKWNELHDRIFEGSQQLAYTDALYRFGFKYEWMLFIDPDEFLIINDYNAFQQYLNKSNLNKNNKTYHSYQMQRLQADFADHFYPKNNDTFGRVYRLDLGKSITNPDFATIQWIHNVEKSVSGIENRFCPMKKQFTFYFENCQVYLLHFKMNGHGDRKLISNMQEYYLNHSIKESDFDFFREMYNAPTITTTPVPVNLYNKDMYVDDNDTLLNEYITFINKQNISNDVQTIYDNCNRYGYHCNLTFYENNNSWLHPSQHAIMNNYIQKVEGLNKHMLALGGSKQCNPYIFIGDSIFYKFRNIKGYYFELFKKTSPLYAIMGDKIEGVGWRLVNGNGFDTLLKMCSHTDYKSKIVVLIGTNNIYLSENLENMLKQYRLLLNNFVNFLQQLKNDNVSVYFMNILPRFDWILERPMIGQNITKPWNIEDDPYFMPINIINEYIKRKILSINMKNLYHIDCNQDMVMYQDKWISFNFNGTTYKYQTGIISNDILYDYLHPTKLGLQYLGRCIKNSTNI